jgi:hypothetical protein
LRLPFRLDQEPQLVSPQLAELFRARRLEQLPRSTKVLDGTLLNIPRVVRAYARELPVATQFRDVVGGAMKASRCGSARQQGGCVWSAFRLRGHHALLACAARGRLFLWGGWSPSGGRNRRQNGGLDDEGVGGVGGKVCAVGDDIIDGVGCHAARVDPHDIKASTQASQRVRQARVAVRPRRPCGERRLQSFRR